MAATDGMIDRNERYSEGRQHERLPSEPSLAVTVVTCMDARIDPHALLGLKEGEAHLIRNAGGVVTEDVIRSLMISQRLLGTTEVLLIQHSGCGMLGLSDEEVGAQVEMDSGIRPPFALESFTDLEGNVRESVARVQASPFVPHKTSIRGFVLDVVIGKLTEVR